MKRILFVDNSTRCFYIFRLQIAKSFVENGYEVYVASPEPFNVYREEIVKCGIVHVPYKISSNYSIRQDIKLMYQLIKIYKKLSPDFIIHYTIKPNIYGSFAAGLLRIKTLSVVPGTGSVFKGNGFVPRIVKFLYKFSFKFAENVWVLNSDDYNSFIYEKIVHRAKLEILPGEGVDIEYFKSKNDYEKKMPFVFLYMGRMLREKGIEHLANASRLLKESGIVNFEVHLLGLIDGLSKDVISEFEINTWQNEGLIKYLGSSNDVRNNISDADCIILPSFYGEGIPRSLMEACSMKRAVLTTDNVGCRDIVKDGLNGLLCMPNNSEDLYKKMKIMIEFDGNTIRKLGENGRKVVEDNFDVKLIVEKYNKFINSYI